MTPVGPGAARSALRTWADLARAGNFPSVASNVLAALALSQASGATWPDGTVLGVAMIAGCLAYAGGATLNDVADARFDAEHRPERVIPRGAIRRGAAATLGAVQLVGGAALLVGLGASGWWAAALVVVIAAYDWLHKRWAGAVLLMGGCRVLLAATLASLPGHAWTNLFGIWVTLLFAYIVGLSLVARREYTLARDGGPAAVARAGRVGRTVGQLLAFIPLVDAAVLAVAGVPSAALAAAAAYPLGRLAQRLAAST